MTSLAYDIEGRKCMELNLHFYTYSRIYILIIALNHAGGAEMLVDDLGGMLSQKPGIGAYR
jgi:hypothetical protein